MLEGPKGVVHALAFSPDGKLLAAGDVRCFVSPSYVPVWYHFELIILFSPLERSFSTTLRRRKYVFHTPSHINRNYMRPYNRLIKTTNHIPFSFRLLEHRQLSPGGRTTHPESTPSHSRPLARTSPPRRSMRRYTSGLSPSPCKA